MLRGLLFGAFWGTALGTVVLGLVSLISEVPGQRAPTPAIESPVIEVLPTIPTEPGIAEPGTAGSRPTGETVRAAAPQSSAAPTLGQDITSPGRQPTPTFEVPSLAQTATPVPDAPRVESTDIAPGLRLPEPPDVSTFAGVALDTAPLRPTAAPDEATTIVRVPAPDAGPPRIAFAAPADVDPEKPLLSVLMLDDPSGQLGPAALQILPFPVSVAIPGTGPDAFARMMAYRDAGFEVVLNAEVPDRASQADIDAAFQYFFDTVPQAIAVLDSTDAAATGAETVKSAVRTVLAETGHGLITFVPDDLGEDSDVPQVVLAIDLDANGQSTSIVRRFLDQAAFEARKDGAYAVMARLRPETITAFQIWSQSSRAQAMNLVPISAILNR